MGRLLGCNGVCLSCCVLSAFQGLSQVIFVVATGKQLLFRQYAIAFKKSGAQVPRTELAEIGPKIDFSIRRSRAAPEEIQTQSMKQPKVEKQKVDWHLLIDVYVFVLTDNEDTDIVMA